MKKLDLSILLSPKIIIFSVVTGGLLGVYSPSIASSLAPVGKLYLSLLSMCIAPLLVFSISSSIASLLKNDRLSHQISKISMLFPVAMTIAIVLGLMIGYVIEPGKNLSAEAQNSLGELINSEVKYNIPVNTDGLLGLFKIMIPGNIFSALTEGNNLSVLFFSLILGVSLGKSKHVKSNEAIGFIEVMYEAFSKMIVGIMYGLPLGLLCLFADQLSQLGPGIIFAVIKFMGAIYLGCAILIGFALLMLKSRLSKTNRQMIDFLKKPALVALTTGSSMASIPAILKAFEDKSKYSTETIHLFVPLSICLSAIGASFLVSLTVVYMMNIYNIPLELNLLAPIVFGSFFAAIAMTGAPGLAALTMLGIVLGPLGLPLEPAVLILVAVIPLIEGAVTFANVVCNVLLVTFVAEKSDLELPAAYRPVDDRLAVNS